MIDILLKEYGEIILHNEKKVLGYYERFDTTKLIKIAKMPRHFYGYEFLKPLLVKGRVFEEDIFTVKGKDFRVYSFKVFAKRGRSVHSEIEAYEDVFKEEVAVYDIKALKGKVLEKGKILCKIKTTGEVDFADYPFLKDFGITHEFVALMEGKKLPVSLHNVLTWKEQNFEVLRIENIDEIDKFLKLWVKRRETDVKPDEEEKKVEIEEEDRI